jgi:hypothetical protein
VRDERRDPDRRQHVAYVDLRVHLLERDQCSRACTQALPGGPLLDLLVGRVRLLGAQQLGRALERPPRPRPVVGLAQVLLERLTEREVRRPDEARHRAVDDEGRDAFRVGRSEEDAHRAAF